ncbi:hypothetical protein VTL71DRAFT_9400 [Oculimacula yallundae]|uniref:Uncharacterized protein n=1 Tax=Oculimacula yallundae TaxID=86028 RepID=A0ABR4BVL0_9HELO
MATYSSQLPLLQRLAETLETPWGRMQQTRFEEVTAQLREGIQAEFDLTDMSEYEREFTIDEAIWINIIPHELLSSTPFAGIPPVGLGVDNEPAKATGSTASVSRNMSSISPAAISATTEQSRATSGPHNGQQPTPVALTTTPTVPVLLNNGVYTMMHTGKTLNSAEITRVIKAAIVYTSKKHPYLCHQRYPVFGPNGFPVYSTLFICDNTFPSFKASQKDRTELESSVQILNTHFQGTGVSINYIRYPFGYDQRLIDQLSSEVRGNRGPIYEQLAFLSREKGANSFVSIEAAKYIHRFLEGIATEFKGGHLPFCVHDMFFKWVQFPGNQAPKALRGVLLSRTGGGIALRPRYNGIHIVTPRLQNVLPHRSTLPTGPTMAPTPMVPGSSNERSFSPAIQANAQGSAGTNPRIETFQGMFDPLRRQRRVGYPVTLGQTGNIGDDAFYNHMFERFRTRQAQTPSAATDDNNKLLENAVVSDENKGRQPESTQLQQMKETSNENGDGHNDEGSKDIIDELGGTSGIIDKLGGTSGRLASRSTRDIARTND